jgi:hypothetical protein
LIADRVTDENRSVASGRIRATRVQLPGGRRAGAHLPLGLGLVRVVERAATTRPHGAADRKRLPVLRPFGAASRSWTSDRLRFMPRI